ARDIIDWKIEYIGEPVIVGNQVKKEDFVVSVTFSDGYVKLLKEEEFIIDDTSIDSIGYNIIFIKYIGDKEGDEDDTWLWDEEVQVKGVKESVYCIGFDTMGGSSIAPIIGIKPNTTITLPQNPTKKGYIFDGWYLDKNYTTKFVGNETIKKTFIVYAKWVSESEPVVKPEPEVQEEQKLWEEKLELQSPVLNVAVGATEAVIVNTMQPGLEIWYGSSNPEVVTVNDNGIITGLKNGRAVIYAYVVDEEIELECKIGVGNVPYITKIKPKKESVEIEKGDTHQIKLKVLPKKIDKSQVSYKTNNSSIASVSANGLVKAKKRGTCYITVKTTDGSTLKEKVKITVY
ncbi:MAG: Ig-like domain-containing protein, partial [Lachnospiraceae bacterium]|nr:Ig-like domain-containing protein [Lachnospiraceae bacterium]